MSTAWRGDLRLRYVSVPVELEPIRSGRCAEADCEEVFSDDVAKGSVRGHNSLTPDELPFGIKEDADISLRIHTTVPWSSIDLTRVGHAYYVRPQMAGQYRYRLIRHALEKLDLVALTTVTIGSRRHLAVLRPTAELLVLHTIASPDDVSSPDFELDESAPLTASDLRLAERLLHSLRGQLDTRQQVQNAAASR